MNNCLEIESPGVDFEHSERGDTASGGLSSVDRLSHMATLDNSGGMSLFEFPVLDSSLKRRGR